MLWAVPLGSRVDRGVGAAATASTAGSSDEGGALENSESGEASAPGHDDSNGAPGKIATNGAGSAGDGLADTEEDMPQGTTAVMVRPSVGHAFRALQTDPAFVGAMQAAGKGLALRDDAAEADRRVANHCIAVALWLGARSVCAASAEAGVLDETAQR